MLTKLKLLRKEHGLSQQYVADAVGISQQSINKYENHNVQPDLDTLKKLADLFHTSIDYRVDHEVQQSSVVGQTVILLNLEESGMLSSYRRLTEKPKTCLRLLLQTWEKSKQGTFRVIPCLLLFIFAPWAVSFCGSGVF